MDAVMMDVSRVYERDQHIHIEQKSHPASSSLKRLTISSVTGAASARRGSSGTPLRVSTGAGLGSRACRANFEIAAPRLMFWPAAKPRAAAKTSSSMATVVRS
jgi:hypothetical protein